jgi:hypothetical protein
MPATVAVATTAIQTLGAAATMLKQVTIMVIMSAVSLGMITVIMLVVNLVMITATMWVANRVMTTVFMPVARPGMTTAEADWY